MMARYAILSRSSDIPARLAVTVESDDGHIKLREYKMLPSQVWVPIFHIGRSTAGVAFINTAGPTVALRGDKENNPKLYASAYRGQNNDDYIIWTFARTDDPMYMNILWAEEPDYAMNAAYSAKEGADVIIYASSKPRPSNEQWNLARVTD